MQRTEQILPWFASVVTLFARLASLLAGEAPLNAVAIEETLRLVTLPCSAIVFLTSPMAADSLLIWTIVSLGWAACTFLQFSLLLLLLRALSSRPTARTITLVTAVLTAVAALLWIATTIPAHPEEEGTVFFIRAPLALLFASLVIFVVLLLSQQRAASR